MASVPDPTYFHLLTSMQMVKASGYVSAHSTLVGIEDWQLVNVFGVSPGDTRRERETEALSTVVSMLTNVRAASHGSTDTVWSVRQLQKVWCSRPVFQSTHLWCDCSRPLCEEMCKFKSCSWVLSENVSLVFALLKIQKQMLMFPFHFLGFTFILRG